ncbi:hypothetical protein CRV08_03020 [Halarcobacter ebronensis]|uniref:Uncharacterized protein n=1 Tax=Halarcobacter ebronensis TaxID=1462615 RepID=A0A4Q0YKS2_9BACT|nr:hypothetical protein [Halarcobacter ebronensis]QKF82796.1 hypothetical protein AEBR_2328 [Halarcobacter ebronensis]RXJ69691.1 hypothetical protein CRV08_03020 [Halarcobacter ebronensis]RXK06820.1 hypothetical protein CRV07_05150 [Halarcobacter ebronensis]
MNKKSKYLISILSLTIIAIFFEIFYLSSFKSLKQTQIDEKLSLLKVTALPDLAISTEAMYIRHRSLADTFSIFKESPELREYFPSTFVYSHSHIFSNTPSKVINEK